MKIQNVESMSVEILLLLALAGVAVLSSLAVLLTRDNFYASLYMSATLIMVAAVYALFDLQPVFVLIVFIFVGAIGIVTVALAATYRFAPERQISGLWALPVIITAFILGFSVYASQLVSPEKIQFALENFITPEYLLLILFLTALIILLMLSVLKMGVGEGGRS
jgi:NADH:ubiquinone oxidoreductase subunit 6 (subunit J)